ncbi:MAG: hypothetical protein IPP81_17080 [Chitinophagaceae bacterium]|nr:hypothetical protein [Chitinophagaceae bacterium]
MIRLISTAILSLLFFISPGQSRFTTKDSLNAVCDKVMQTLVDGKYSAAIQMLKGRSVMDATVVDNIDKTLNEQMANILPYYGRIMGYEMVDEKFLKNTVTRRRYILQFEYYFLSFDFVLYNNSKGWSVSHFYYKDETKELF